MERERFIRVSIGVGVVVCLLVGFFVVYGTMMEACGGCGCGCKYIG